MSRQFNTDGLMAFPSDNGEPITLNAFESIECAIAFDVRDWSDERRSAWIYSIVFGLDNEEWDKVAKEFGWDEEDRKRANMMHEQWIKAKEKMEQPEIVKCLDCKHGSIYMTEDVCGKTLIECNHPELGDNIAIHAWDWFCADGERREAK